jgi:N-acetylglucosaminyl-diphospho-decaprenol L-rhamnosyltransferase
MEHNNVSCLIVTYNSEEVISNLLTDLFRIIPDGPVIVIDNASSDQTVCIIHNQFPGVQVIQNVRNVGYGRAVNQGVEMCHTPYIFVLNPDISIPDSQTVTELVDFLEASPLAGATGPLQYTVDQNGMGLNFICSYWSWRSFTSYIYYRSQQQWPAKEPIKVPFLNAGCIMIRRSVFIKVGKLNPKYFLYGEDPDLGLKLVRHGYESWLLPNVSVVHFREKA